MKKLLVPIIGLLTILVLSSCSLTIITGSGQIVTEERDVTGFHGVELTAYGDLRISQGEAESLVIQGDDNIIRHMITEVKNGILVIRFDDNYGNIYKTTERIEFNLVVKEIDRIDFSGAGEVNAEDLISDTLSVSLSGAGDIEINNLTTTSLSVDLSGAGDIEVDNLYAENLSVSLSGAGNFDLSGVAASQSITLSGVGNFNAEDLESRTGTVTLTGAGNASVWIKDTLSVSISGAGNVNYYGDPAITQNITGVGRVSKRGEK